MKKNTLLLPSMLEAANNNRIEDLVNSGLQKNIVCLYLVHLGLKTQNWRNSLINFSKSSLISKIT